MANLEAIRHSASHVLAQAVLRLFPTAKLGIGPAIENGFYYDFELPTPLTPEDLVKIEAEMKSIIKENLPLIKETLSKQEAMKRLQASGQTFKQELLADLPDTEAITFYSQGDFSDLCKGPHVAYTRDIKAFKLQKISGAYWRGKETNPMLQRIYGIAFETKDELAAYLTLLEEAEKRDHRKLGKELDLFSLQDKAGAGLVYWHPKGARIRHIIETFWKEEHFKRDYELLNTPHIGQSWLWETSGHLGFYNENMFAPMKIDEQDYYAKPMNCPFHILIYNSSLRSYRDLPLRWAELGTVYRYERSGVLHGLMRVRGFTQDDSHIICTPDQVESEVFEVIKFAKFILQTMGFNDMKYYLSTRPASAVGDASRWEQAETALRNALAMENINDYEVDEGGGAFYGPKIDIKIKDAIGREWQLSTIQFDFNLPDRFDMTYIGQDGQKHRTIMIHRALFGSLERFFGILIEHYAGKFPFWLSPEQFRILTINDSDATTSHAKSTLEHLKHSGFRGSLDDRNEKLGLKIREAQVQHIPFALIIGDKEAQANQIALRKRGEQSTTLLNLDEVTALFQGLQTQKVN